MKKEDFKKILDRNIETENMQFNFDKIGTMISWEAAGAFVIYEHLNSQNIDLWDQNILTE